MSFHTARLLRDAIGVEGVYRTADCTVHAVPADREALVGAMRVAGSHGFFAASSGSGSWQVLDGPQDIELSLRAMNRVIDVRPADMVMTVEAGATIETLRRVALDHDTWLALDPPGNPGRTIGSVLATATSGPLRHGFGGVREQVLGLTAVTVPARVMHAGGTTVKNVAGFDLTSLHVGGFGAFGAIAQCHVRLRARPRADTTWTATGSRNDLLRLARALIAARIEAAAVELFSPDLAGSAAWTLAVRLAAGDAAVAASGAALQVLSGGWRELLPERQMLLWNSTARLLATPPVTLRLGALPTDLPSVLDELEPVVGPGLISVGALGHIRWAGDTGMMELRRLRARLAPRGVPVVLERGPWRVRAGAGHFGACRPGVAALTQRLRAAFDPDELFVTPLEERDDP